MVNCLVGVSVWAVMSNEDEKKVVERMMSVHRERGVSSRSSYCHYLRSSEPYCRPAHGSILKSPQIVDVRGMKGKDTFRMRWTS